MRLAARLRREEVERLLDAAAPARRAPLELHLARLDLGEVEDVVDDREQRLAGGADRVDEVALLGGELVSSRRLVMPMTPFIGVRISCDMEARNSLLAREAASASALARRSWCSVSTRAVMSVSMAMKFSTSPAWLRTGWTSRWR
jgi:hypothetical protein